jgi:Mn2+/Fe2+ NRAMP family transporter
MFCTLGAGVMFKSGVKFADSSGAFAGQVIDLYTSSLGAWSRPIIVVSAFTTMFSTLLTVVDGFPRALQLLARRFKTPEDPAEVMKRSGNSWDYWVWMAVLSIGGMLIIIFYLKKLTGLVDLATTLSFLTGPFLGFLTYRAIMSPYVPKEFRPEPWRRVLAILGITFLTAFMLFFLYSKFVMKV